MDVLFCFGAGNEARTRYLHLGKVALYQMSYARTLGQQAHTSPSQLKYIYQVNHKRDFTQQNRQKNDPDSKELGSCWRYLFYRAVTSQVSSAEMSLTTVFGMGTGGPSS